MCGIAGVFAYGASAHPVDEAELLRVRDAMRRRGPEGAGHWISADRRVGLAHRRLAIIDVTETGAQPMASADGRLVVTLNGEIYNFRELRREIEAEGTRLRSRSDTEVLLHLFARHGPRMLDKLRGMFAIAIWDAEDRRLFLARDPFGIKPLYYADDGGTLRFASQVKALVAGDRVDTRPDPAGSVGFFLWGAVPDPHTLFEGIRALPAGTHVTYRQGASGRTQAYFRLAEELARGAEAPLSEAQGRDRLRAALVDSVRHHLVADVPVGVFLSAGLDSTTLTALASELNQGPLRTLTLGFHEHRGTPDDEVAFAEDTARRHGTRHQTSWVEQSDFATALEDLLAAMDQPSVDGVNTYLVSRAASRAGMKVALSGIGGDELFGGYPSFSQVPRMAAWLRPLRGIPRAGKAVRRLSGPLLRTLRSPKYAGLAEYGGSYAGAYLLQRALYAPWEIERFMDPVAAREGWERLRSLDALAASLDGLGTPRQRVAALELGWYMRHQLLRDADWAGMAHSLEIRVPFVDVELLRAVAPLLAAANPPSKRTVAATPLVLLPPALLRRQKTGFSTPICRWMEATVRPPGRAHGLRAWALAVHPPLAKRRTLAVLTDAHGGRGGIALYGRDLLEAVCAMPRCAEVVAAARHMPDAPEPVAPRLRYLTAAAGGRWRFALAVLREGLGTSRRFDLVICGHLNLLPLAFLAARAHRAPLLLLIYGKEAWEPARSPLTGWLARRADRVVSISELTRSRFVSWSGVPPSRTLVLPNAIHLERYGPGPRSAALVSRYGLSGKTVLMTLGRMDADERYKGFDEVIEAMPGLLADGSDLVYLCVGDGSDLDRLRRKAVQLGVAGRVTFTGRIPEAEKADHYRLADAYVMPSRGEGFGYALLEAMACGVPVVASRKDGGKEAVRDGLLGVLVDPDDPEDVARGVREALRRPRGVPPGLDSFSLGAFRASLLGLLEELLASS